MLYLAVIGGCLAVALALAVLYDFRARRRGWRVYASTFEASQNRLTPCKARQSGRPTWSTPAQRTVRRRDSVRRGS